MKLKYKDQRVAVYDDFLAIPEHAEVLRYFDTAPFRKVMPAGWGKGYRLSNGDPLVGTQYKCGIEEPNNQEARFPTRTPLDFLFERLLASHIEISAIVGQKGDAWTSFTMCPYVYPSGSSLGWHADIHVAGAYIFYAHSKWSHDWGGELLVSHCDEDCAPYSSSSRGIMQNKELEEALRDGMGYYFAPIPNRMIILRGSTPHAIKPVEVAAGDNVRLSLSGFFVASDRDAQE